MIDLSHESEQELERMATRAGYRATTPEGRVAAQRELSHRTQASAAFNAALEAMAAAPANPLPGEPHGPTPAELRGLRR